MRVNELEGLTLADISFADRKVTIRQAKGLKDRVVYLTDTVIQALDVHS